MEPRSKTFALAKWNMVSVGPVGVWLVHLQAELLCVICKEDVGHVGHLSSSGYPGQYYLWKAFPKVSETVLRRDLRKQLLCNTK